MSEELLIDGEGEVTFRKDTDGGLSIEIFAQSSLADKIEQVDVPRLITWLRKNYPEHFKTNELDLEDWKKLHSNVGIEKQPILFNPLGDKLGMCK